MDVFQLDPAEDFDPDDPNKSFDCNQLDRVIRILISRSREALGKDSRSKQQVEFFVTILEMYFQTHMSIRELCKDYGSHHGRTGDALSLVREQIEKLFALQIVIEDPDLWVPLYWKNGWVKMYSAFLHRQRETARLPRFTEFMTSSGPQYLDELRIHYGISEKSKRCVELIAMGRGVSEDLQGHKIAKFPTPRGVTEKLKDPNRREFMNRWYVEYVRYCEYAHSSSLKAFICFLQVSGSRCDPIMRHEFLSRHVEGALLMSYISFGSAAAEICQGIEVPVRNSGLKLELDVILRELWDLLRTSSHDGQIFYNLRVAKLLAPVGG